MAQPDTFAARFRAMRLSIIDPETGKPMTQKRIAERLGVNLNTVRNYEYGHTLPHLIIRRELVRLFPDAFSRVLSAKVVN